MSRVVFFLEEKSAAILLEIMIPRLFPSLDFICLKHEGKNDLEKSLIRKLRGWTVPGDRFVVLRDADNDNCVSLKNKLTGMCGDAGRPETLVRIACQELESWYFGSPDALALALGDPKFNALRTKAKYRDPDAITRPSFEITKHCPAFQKVRALCD